MLWNAQENHINKDLEVRYVGFHEMKGAAGAWKHSTKRLLDLLSLSDNFKFKENLSSTLETLHYLLDHKFIYQNNYRERSLL